MADDGNMKKLLTITRELKEDFDKEDYAHIYYLGRSSRWFIRMLEFLSTPVDKKYTLRYRFPVDGMKIRPAQMSWLKPKISRKPSRLPCMGKI